MITEDEFKNYINQIGEAYEDLKDHAVKCMDNPTDTMNHYEKLAKLRGYCLHCAKGKPYH